MSFCGFCCFRGSQSENERHWKDRQILGSCQRAEKVLEHKGNGDTNWSLCTWNSSKRLGKKTGEIGNQRNDKIHPNYTIVKIS